MLISIITKCYYAVSDAMIEAMVCGLIFDLYLKWLTVDFDILPCLGFFLSSFFFLVRLWWKVLWYVNRECCICCAFIFVMKLRVSIWAGLLMSFNLHWNNFMYKLCESSCRKTTSNYEKFEKYKSNFCTKKKIKTEFLLWKIV